ncbi:MAG: efflux RND transporter periplasmic adaptor subunit [Alphaproteobacteria bacterium]|nr:efflux RND transporter periplasmic adaptor subunit [Alphaproteobacteria bacterium]
MGRIFILVLLAAVIVAGGYVYLRDADTNSSAARSQTQRPAIPVEMVVVKGEPFIEQEGAVGSLASDEAVIIRSEIAGRVDEIGFIEGQPITKGDLIITIDDSIYRAEFNQAEARLNLSQANYDRAVNLEGRGAGTQRALDEASSKLQEDRATLDLARARLDRTKIHAPFSGVMGIRKVSPGDYLMAGQEIVNLEAIDPIKVAFALPEVMLSVAKTGQSVVVQIDAFPDENFIGEVYAIDPRIEASGRSVTLRARVPNPDGRLRPGLFARVGIIFERRENAIMIPERALVPIQTRQTVFVVENGIVSLRDVTTGGHKGGNVEITSGLSVGDTVVTGGQLKLREGATVVDAANMMSPGA